MTLSSLDGKNYDVIVCGAGSAGVAAACCAARAGARTLLLERHGFGGGILTAAMIHTFDAIKSCVDNDIEVVAGFARELLDEIAALGGAATPDNPPEALTVHPEIQKVAIDRLLAHAGVTTLYHAHVCGVTLDGRRVTGVEAALRDGRARFGAGFIVDATGDAEIAFYAGAPYHLSEELQALTYHFRLGNVDPRPDWRQWEEIMGRAMQAAHAAGEIKVFGGPWVIRLAGGEISVNSTRVYGNPVDPVQLSAAEVEGRAQMLLIWNLLRRRVPELAECYILSGASQLHIRESRIIDGEYQLTEDDIREGTRFPDSIAIGAWPVDIHPSNGVVGVHPHKENPPVPYEIPFRCLIPRDTDGLLVAGKPISTSHRAHGSTRVPGTSLATGQAAGVAAALAVRGRLTVRGLDPAVLQAALRAGCAHVSVP
jgi:glycine/D-amino acid oxidase-like deaminating enzyme